MRHSADGGAARGARNKVVHAAVAAGLLALTLLVGRLGAAVTQPALEVWYRDLAKPSWTPPDLAFPIVWTALYILMALAAWRVWHQGRGAQRRWALALWGLQLALNALWSQLFFGLRDPGLALVELGFLLGVLLATIALFARASRAAAWLMLPYLAWSGYAFALNAAIWRMNA
jgi:tryptophan-rich sensory protein